MKVERQRSQEYAHTEGNRHNFKRLMVRDISEREELPHCEVFAECSDQSHRDTDQKNE